MPRLLYKYGAACLCSSPVSSSHLGETASLDQVPRIHRNTVRITGGVLVTRSVTAEGGFTSYAVFASGSYPSDFIVQVINAPSSVGYHVTIPQHQNGIDHDGDNRIELVLDNYMGRFLGKGGLAAV